MANYYIHHEEIKFFDQLPDDIKQIDNIIRFKLVIKNTYNIQLFYYSVSLYYYIIASISIHMYCCGLLQ